MTASVAVDPVQPELFKTVEYQRFVQSISNIAAYNNINFSDYLALQRQAADLLQEPQHELFAESVKQLYEQYDWALRPLSILFATVNGVK
jgi:hypothetical protein|tara:strand:+ start:1170 stop:1439 length:270 start_codon:yes stop_codon:yes gene_type:complete